MTAIRPIKSSCFLAGLQFLVLVACGHDAKRDNPLDPQLTPPVELQIALDDTAGTAILTWTPYTGATAFDEYLVLRNIEDRTSVDTLARIESAETTSFVDTTMAANTAYEYRVAVVNASGFEVPSLEDRTGGYSVSPVNLLSATYEPQAGGVVVSWSRFHGSRFNNYRVERVSADKVDFEPLGEPVEAVADTTFIDTDVVPDVFYRYRVVVEVSGEAWTSDSSVPVRFLSGPVFLRPVELNPREGTATLSWSRYEGDQPFRSYRVRRRLAEESSSATIDSISVREQLTYVDDAVEADQFYIYTIAVLTEDGEQLVSDPVQAFFRMEPSSLEVAFDPDRGRADLTWTRAVAGFERYAIRRRTVGGFEFTLETITNIDDTTHIDRTLEENEEYGFRIVTVSTTGAEFESSPVLGPVVPRIAFYSFRGGNWEVYIMNPDGTGLVNLTNHPNTDGPGRGQIGRPAWSPDGRRIAFVSSRDNSQGDVFVMNADGSDPVNLTDHVRGDSFPSWSPDGSRIAFASGRDGDLDVYAMDADGSNLTQLTDSSEPRGWPAWSPDGSRIAFGWFIPPSNNEIFVMNADGSNQVNLTNDSERKDWDADWSPDGTRIAFESGNLDFGEIDVYVMDADGGNVVNLTNSPDTFDGWPDWSPRWIADRLHLGQGRRPRHLRHGRRRLQRDPVDDCPRF